MHILVKTMLGFAMPAGSFSCGGRQRDVLRRMLSICRWRFQKGPLRSWSRSSVSGRCRCTRFRPNKQAMSTIPPYEESLPAPSGLVQSFNDWVCSGRLILKASSEEGRLVIMSRSSIVMGQPVPMLAYRSWQKAIQKVRRRSSRSVQSFGGARHCLTSSPVPSRR